MYRIVLQKLEVMSRKMLFDYYIWNQTLGKYFQKRNFKIWLSFHVVPFLIFTWISLRYHKQNRPQIQSNILAVSHSQILFFPPSSEIKTRVWFFQKKTFRSGKDFTSSRRVLRPGGLHSQNEVKHQLPGRRRKLSKSVYIRFHR